MRAMLSISRTYENTADYKIQTHSERSLGRYEMSHAPKTEQSELSLFSLRLQCQCGAERALKESGAEQSVLRQIPPL